MHKWKLAIAVLAITLFAAWYAFRPERLVVNHRVNEGFPAGEDPSSAQVLESGTFYGVVHPTAVQQPSTALETEIAFSASRTSALRTVQMCMCTWSPLTM